VAQRIAPVDLQDPSSRLELGEILKRALSDENLEMLLVFEETEFLHGVIDPQAGAVDLPRPGSAFLLKAIREGNATRVLSSTGQEPLVLLAASALEREGAPATVIVAGTMLDPALHTQALVQAYQAYRRSEIQKPDLQAIYVLTFLMITLVILLISSWVGLYLARRVTVPIQALADGTKRIISGDLSHRVDVEAGDELGVLVESFNVMTTELVDNKELLERKNRELTRINTSLDEERGRIRAVLQNVTAGVLSVDQNGKVLTCNGAALEMLHQEEPEILGLTLETAWQDEERTKLLALFEYDPLGRSRREVQVKLGGESRTFAVSASTMFDGAGDITGHVLVLEDLTELIEAKQLATWVEAARRIAHEIKNPLTPIRLAAERIRYRFKQSGVTLDEGAGEAVENSVETIVREVDSMKQMVAEFSRFARMPRPQPTVVDLEGLFSETLKLYEGVKSGIEMEFEVDDKAREGHFDKEQMRSVLINLLDNAVEASQAPGCIRLTSSSQNGSILLSVEDTGPGIPPADKKKLFQPYFSTKGRGTGLGLAIVHRVVNDHNGTIQVEDNQPQGTIFRIELPQ
jgi:two-component system nitrogen regulation sensor histidine kinase NtrY